MPTIDDVSSSALPVPTDALPLFITQGERAAVDNAPLLISFDSTRIISINYQVDKT
eukprot:CAMPEP_0201135514 /NCGR_PEP_ID=MMETSP0850-20130426/54355_1 /ASSEMBLY_ACC=CAM_ASM_000622 /TAXON_ID=183588 /ORGANISM="Pseudo-nitzschia fraudulenta, Strain WWA7" /LENGTH=55 /DNA_ID=CAMNT_0047406685 /DNA_START=1599 /DNA_END=1762 /DNA_ORIENTATION=+